MIGCDPAANADVLYVAVPLLIVPVPSVVPPSANVTIPVVVAGVTVAVNVADEPNVVGFADEVSVVLAWLRTFSEAEPLTAPAVAVSVVPPIACARAMPAVPAELLMAATEGFDEVQITD